MEFEKINAELQAIVEGFGYEFVGVEVVEEEGTQVLRLYADTAGGIKVEDCERISEAASTCLDAYESQFAETYLMEVSSPGIERPLFKPSDYERFVGKPASVRLKQPVDGRRRLSGSIAGVHDGIITFDCEGETVEIPFEKVASAHLLYIHEKGKKKTFEKKGGRK